MTTSGKEIPSPETLENAVKVEIWDEKGQTVAFGSIFEGQRSVVVFIRVFSFSYGVD